jgi:hypothetical protein
MTLKSKMCTAVDPKRSPSLASSVKTITASCHFERCAREERRHETCHTVNIAVLRVIANATTEFIDEDRSLVCLGLNSGGMRVSSIDSPDATLTSLEYKREGRRLRWLLSGYANQSSLLSCQRQLRCCAGRRASDSGSE